MSFVQSVLSVFQEIGSRSKLALLLTTFAKRLDRPPWTAAADSRLSALATRNNVAFAPLLTILFVQLQAGTKLFVWSSFSGTINPTGGFKFRLVVDGTPVQGCGSEDQNIESFQGALNYATSTLTTGAHSVSLEWASVQGDDLSLLTIDPVGRPDFDHASLMVGILTP